MHTPEERLAEKCRHLSMPSGLVANRMNGLPDWWSENGNVLLTSETTPSVSIVAHPGLPPPTNAVVALASEAIQPVQIMVWGDGATIYIGPRTNLPGAALNCGGGSSIVIGNDISTAGSAVLNARNGGSIFVDSDGLWSNHVVMVTDDMHAILDAITSQRINRFGGRIEVGAHVWLGFDVLLIGDTTIGSDSIIGGRAVLKGTVPDATVAAGNPCRPIRSGVTWTHEDLPA